MNRSIWIYKEGSWKYARQVGSNTTESLWCMLYNLLGYDVDVRYW